MPTLTRRHPGAELEMYYADGGAGDPPIVFIHGFGCDHQDWRHQVGALAGGHRVLAVDLAGHGRSTRDLRGVRVEWLGEDVAGLLAELDLQGACLVGHSLGCRVAMRAARTAPERVASVVLVDGSRIGEGEAASLEAQARAVFGERGFDATVAALFAQMFLPGSDPALRAAIEARAARLRPDVGIPLFASLVAFDAAQLEDTLGGLAARILVIQSTYLNADRVRVPLGAGQSTPWLDLVRRLRPDATIEIVSGVGHFTMLEAAERVSELVGAAAVSRP